MSFAPIDPRQLAPDTIGSKPGISGAGGGKPPRKPTDLPSIHIGGKQSQRERELAEARRIRGLIQTFEKGARDRARSLHHAIDDVSL